MSQLPTFTHAFQRILAARGLWSKGKLTKKGEAFLHPDFTKLEPPDQLPDMAKAVARLAAAKKNNEKILIFGDYDADGVTAAAVLTLALKALGHDVVVDLPDRIADGYGLPPRIIESAKNQKINLVITVDCGSRDHDTIAALKAQNIDVIVTDHHEIDQLPPANAVINPKRKDGKYQHSKGFRDYAGVGVAWQLARAAGLRDPAAKWLLDLVAIGTICDLMPLERDNRLLVYYGLLVLAKTTRPGLKELLKSSKGETPTTETIGFRLGPRINAAGRIAHPKAALDLLLAESRPECASLAKQLESLNEKRQKMVEAALETLPSDPIVLGDFHEGIIGLIASRLTDLTNSPSFVFTTTPCGHLKCSARATPGFSVSALIDTARSKNLLIKGGGHAAAGGLTVEQGKFTKLKTLIESSIKSHQKSTDPAATARTLPIDLHVDHFSDLSVPLLKELQLLAPFGVANPEPLFQTTALLTKISPLGKEQKHLSFVVASPDAKTLRLIRWNAPAEWHDLPLGEPVTAIFRLRGNSWSGTCKIEGELEHIFLA
ncbi:single-stranded-DNA-specific exonuclease RecJ [Candidatus Saccharibacteria bacterium]|nr:single-stranded-DNA-specific exonuclease RecJ [Candidatus Saccharibacteria bacterium]